MEITLQHYYDSKAQIEKKVEFDPNERNSSFLLTNKIGGFFSIPVAGKLISKFQGSGYKMRFKTSRGGEHYRRFGCFDSRY